MFEDLERLTSRLYQYSVRQNTRIVLFEDISP